MRVTLPLLICLPALLLAVSAAPLQVDSLASRGISPVPSSGQHKSAKPYGSGSNADDDDDGGDGGDGGDGDDRDDETTSGASKNYRYGEHDFKYDHYGKFYGSTGSVKSQASPQSSKSSKPSSSSPVPGNSSKQKTGGAGGDPRYLAIDDRGDGRGIADMNHIDDDETSDTESNSSPREPFPSYTGSHELSDKEKVDLSEQVGKAIHNCAKADYVQFLRDPNRAQN
ncbi:hypothetical protein RI367_001978 [Sorochytrium milnesiophthora]